MKVDFEILSAVAEDSDAIATLVNSGYRGEYSRQGWTHEDDILSGTRIDARGVRNLLGRSDTVVLKYVREGRILGCVELAHHDDKIYLGMLTVDPANQALGIGRKLLAAGEEHARNLGCTSVYMTVIYTRRELIEWYGRRGYCDTGKTKPFDNTDPVFGIPKRPIHFMVLEKHLGGLIRAES